MNVSCHADKKFIQESFLFLLIKIESCNFN